MFTKSQIQAVIMAAGKGSRMTELTARKPKCLLPIGNLPMIWFPLNLLQRTGFQDVFIIVLETNKSEIQAALEKFNLKIKIELIGIPAGEDWGTADSLRYLEESNKIKSDLLVLSCDLITNVNLQPLFEQFRKHNATVAALFAPVSNSSPITVPGPKSKNKTEKDFIGIEENTSRLVFVASASDFEEELPLPCRLVKKFGRIALNSQLLDAHVYIFARALCKYLVSNKNISTIKGELLPHVVRKQMQPKHKKMEQDKAASVIGVDLKTDLQEMSEESELILKARLMSTFTDSRLEPVYRGDSLRCYAHLADGITIRANSLMEYTRVNRLILEKWSELTGIEGNRISPTATISSTQVDSDSCLVGDKADVAEKTSIKSTILASNVKVSPKTRIMSSVIMASASIGVGCSIQNCIVCEDSVVSDGCELKDCLVGSHFTVPIGGKHCNEVLTDVDHLMEI